MSDKFFLDSNIVLYAVNGEDEKKEIALSLLERTPLLSTQVLSEVSSVCLRKLKFIAPVVEQWLTLLISAAYVHSISIDDIRYALQVSNRYHYGFYDSLIIATALITKAEVLYSEDMHHGQVIEHLKIINPFHS